MERKQIHIFFARLALVVFVTFLVAGMLLLAMMGLDWSKAVLSSFLFYASVFWFGLGAVWYVFDFARFKRRLKHENLEEDAVPKVDNHVHAFCYAFLCAGVLLYLLSYLMT